MNRPWTQAELEVLVSSMGKKKIPNRSKKSIRRKLILLGLIQPSFKIKFHHKRAWTQDEIKILKSAKNPRTIKISNRSRESVVSMAGKLGLLEKNPPRKPWKKKDEKLLIKLIKAGKTPRQICLMNVFSKPYSRNGIQKKVSQLGLAKPIPKADKFFGDIMLKFKNFLLENWKGKTPKELVDLWNGKNARKVKKNKVVYHLTSMKIKIPYAEVMVINNLKKKEELIKKVGGNTAKNVEENLRLARAKIMRDRIEKNRDIWTGLPIKEDIA